VLSGGADHPADDGLDGLRALCVVHWSRHPTAGAPAAVVPADGHAAAALHRWGLMPR
jgi:hypothetical protein